MRWPDDAPGEVGAEGLPQYIVTPIIVFGVSATHAQTATLVLLNGRIATADRACTIRPACAACPKGVSGSMEVEKYADIIVLDKDLLDIPASEILDTEVLYTIVAGEVVFARRDGND